jgi:hypothetical protein
VVVWLRVVVGFVVIGLWLMMIGLWVVIGFWMIGFGVMIGFWMMVGFWVVWFRFVMIWGRMVGLLVVGNMMVIGLVVIRFRMVCGLGIMRSRMTIWCRCRMVNRGMSIGFRVPVGSRMVYRGRSVRIMMTIWFMVHRSRAVVEIRTTKSAKTTNFRSSKSRMMRGRSMAAMMGQNRGRKVRSI